MPIIIPFDTGLTIALHLIDKLIYLILLLLWIFQDIVFTCLHSSVNYVYVIVLHHLPDWKSTPALRRDKNRNKASHGAGKFSKKLCSNKESCHNERNWKSGRHNHRHTFLRCKPLKICQDTSTTSLPDLKVKTRSVGGTKFPSPCRRDQMIRAIHRCQVAKHLDLSDCSQHILPYDEPDLYNDFIAKEPDYKDHLCINFPCHCVLGHVLSDSDPLNDLGPWQEVVRPTKKPRSTNT